jgi:hypothetical protein
MAKQIARLLGTTAMADLDLPAVAALLRSKGRKGDTVLAHINPKEAALLRKRGGAGTINPDTGLPEFYDGEDVSGFDPGSMYSSPAQSPYDDYVSVPETPAISAPVLIPETAALPAPEAPAAAPLPGEAFSPYQQNLAKQAADLIAARTEGAPPAKPDENMFKRAAAVLGISPERLLGLGLSGVGAIATGMEGRRQQKQAQQARQETAAIGQPYSQAGQSMIAQAQRGELTPMSQQRLQAARAALSQGIERRGGVGVQQAATQLEAFRQQLLDNQYNYGLKVAQIGDTYASRAIQTGLTQDREIASLMQNLSRALGGFVGSQPTVGSQTGAP